MFSVCAVVVTHNRVKLLQHCLQALENQTRHIGILVVDNASTDATATFLQAWSDIDGKWVVHSEINLGGSGGFALGMEKALEMSGADWIWLLDDDACPALDAVERLLLKAVSYDFVYGSVALGDTTPAAERLCWPVRAVDAPEELKEYVWQLDDQQAVSSLPFLGFLISRSLVRRVGLPDASFFMCADDVDYSTRVRAVGGSLILIKDSVLRHPMPQRRCFSLLGKRIDYRIQSMEKTYYEVRNKIRVARRHWPSKVWTQTVPGLLLRLLVSLVYERARVARLRSFYLGLIHGVRDIGGRRVD